MNIVIGGAAIDVTSNDPSFLDSLGAHYASFIKAEVDEPDEPIRLHIESTPGFETSDPEGDVRIGMDAGLWHIARGDFEARYDPVSLRGVVRQNPNRHSIDSVIRIVHTLTLAGESGFLLHSASAVRKTGETFLAWATPFTGEPGTPGKNLSAPIEALCFLTQAPENRLIPTPEPEAARLLLTNILSLAADRGLVNRVFESACRLAASVKSFRFEFAPHESAWELIR